MKLCPSNQTWLVKMFLKIIFRNLFGGKYLSSRKAGLFLFARDCFCLEQFVVLKDSFRLSSFEQSATVIRATCFGPLLQNELKSYFLHSETTWFVAILVWLVGANTRNIAFYKITNSRFTRRSFHEPNLIRIKADPSYLDRRKMLISVKLLTKYVMKIYALGSVHETFGVWIRAVPKSLQRRNSRPR